MCRGKPQSFTESKTVDGGFKYLGFCDVPRRTERSPIICPSEYPLLVADASYANNCFVRIKADTVIGSQVSTDDYRHNQDLSGRISGYRLEMIAVHNETSVRLRRFRKIISMQGELMNRNLYADGSYGKRRDYGEMNHYPYWVHFIDGKGQYRWALLEWYNQTRIISSMPQTGNWYGISRKIIESMSACITDQKDTTTPVMSSLWTRSVVTAARRRRSCPSGTSDVNHIGMSGKWLMFAINGTVYRLDTTNVANVEVVPNGGYTDNQQFTFCVDDEVVINGWWYYYETVSRSSMSGPRIHTATDSSGAQIISRYKTYAYQNFSCSTTAGSSERKAYLCTPYPQ